MDGRALLRWAAAEFNGEKRLETELLLCHVLHTSRALLLAHSDEEVDCRQEAQFRRLVERYCAGEPLQYLLGTADFMGLELLVTPAVLIPRFDTERLAERALQLLEPLKRPTVLDVCTGSGAIAIAISHYRRDAAVYAGDLSAEALQVAAANNRRCQTNVRLERGNLLEPFTHLAGQVDLVVSNPPYVTTQEMGQLPRDVRREPRLALWGGDDGLYFYRKLAASAPKLLREGGWLALEIGWRQGEAVWRLLEAAGFTEIELLQDWQGLDRVVCGRRP